MDVKIKMMMDGDEGQFSPLLSLEDDMINSGETYVRVMPLLPLKNTVMFPGVVIPITIGRSKSISAIKAAESKDNLIIVATQKDQQIEEPGSNDLYDTGVVAKVMKVLAMPDGSMTAILQGRKKASIGKYISTEPHFEVEVTSSHENLKKESKEFKALSSSLRDTAGQIIEFSPHIPSEAKIMLQNIKNNFFLMNFIASNLNCPSQMKQQILTTIDPVAKGEIILKQMNSELGMLQLKSKIESKVRGDLEKQQRDYFLNQQLRTIQEELGGNPQEEEIKALEEKAKSKSWSEAIDQHFKKEVNKIRRVNPQVAEYSVQLNYLELLLELPWDEITEDNFDLKHVKKVLDRDHFGMNDIKDRIIEHLAILKLRKDLKAPILCLVGPPGVGKTSLGKSIAEALGRKFVRMSLGGLHDESELRGHRKTYIGAMPGRLIKSLKKVQSSNPVFILDEIDKLGRDHRGDPSSALLEILDPEQNHSFYDNYLEVEYDLSKVMFIATANSLSSIQPALLDRMEIIELSGYSIEEKQEIAKNHLLPKQLDIHGLTKGEVSITGSALEKIIEEHTRESGVRNLDRTIANVMRNIAKRKAMEENYPKKLQPQDIENILGIAKYSKDDYAKVKTPGVAVGLAWTSVGGDILFIETSASRGSGKLNLTGNLGDVMKESASTALSYIKSHAVMFDIDPDYFSKHDLHIHVPQGAIPKDGPSAGITMLTSMYSAIKNVCPQSFVAMTGEITLRGKVLPVGGIKEKILAAKRAGIKKIVLCSQNKKHVDEVNEQYIKGVTFTYVDDMNEVLKHTVM